MHGHRAVADVGVVVRLERLRRVIRKPLRYLVRRAADEVRQEALRATLWLARRGRGPLVRATPPGPLQAVLELTERTGAEIGAWNDAARAVREDPVQIARLEKRADAARQRRMELFGDAPVLVSRPPQWHIDVNSGFGWPLGFHRKIDYRNIGRPSDVKVAWELSRLRHLVTLAQHVGVTGNDQSLAVLNQDLSDWIAQNPVGWSVNWSSAMEVALRAVNLVCIDGILSAHGRAYEARPQLVRALYQHGWFLSRNLEVSDINGNHFLANAVGMVWLGRYFDGVGESADWTRTGRAMVLDAARNQVLEDGLDHEGSLPYHALVLEMFLVALHADREVLPDVHAAVSSMVHLATTWTGGNGTVPPIGDDDGGRVLALSDEPSDDPDRVLGLARSVLGPSEAPEAGTDEDLWLCGPSAAGATGFDLPTLPAHFPIGGIAVLGTGADRVTVDVGPVGFRGRGGHGHLDALSFEAVLAGEVAVRDSGTGSYTRDPALRNELRDAAAHTVIVIDGIRYASLGSEAELWAITGDAVPTVLSCEERDGSHVLEVRQQLPAAAGVATIERRIEWRPGQLSWVDRVAAPDGAAVEMFVQLPAGTEITDTTLVNDAFWYEVSAPAGAQVDVDPARWSRHYGAVRTASRATVRYEADGNSQTTRWDVGCR